MKKVIIIFSIFFLNKLFSKTLFLEIQVENKKLEEASVPLPKPKEVDDEKGS